MVESLCLKILADGQVLGRVMYDGTVLGWGLGCCMLVCVCVCVCCIRVGLESEGTVGIVTLVV